MLKNKQKSLDEQQFLQTHRYYPIYPLSNIRTTHFPNHFFVDFDDFENMSNFNGTVASSYRTTWMAVNKRNTFFVKNGTKDNMTNFNLNDYKCVMMLSGYPIHTRFFMVKNTTWNQLDLFIENYVPEITFSKKSQKGKRFTFKTPNGVINENERNTMISKGIKIQCVAFFSSHKSRFIAGTISDLFSTFFN